MSNVDDHRSALGARPFEVGAERAGARLVLGNLPGAEPELTTAGIELRGWEARIHLLS